MMAQSLSVYLLMSFHSSLLFSPEVLLQRERSTPNVKMNIVFAFLKPYSIPRHTMQTKNVWGNWGKGKPILYPALALRCSSAEDLFNNIRSVQYRSSHVTHIHLTSPNYFSHLNRVAPSSRCPNDSSELLAEKDQTDKSYIDSLRAQEKKKGARRGGKRILLTKTFFSSCGHSMK
jgi:hypothetical protein